MIVGADQREHRVEGPTDANRTPAPSRESRGGELVGVHDAGAPVDAALGAGRGEPGHRALMDDVSFEFGNAAMTALCIKAKGFPAMQQGGEAGTSDPWGTVTNRASGGLPHGFWASG